MLLKLIITTKDFSCTISLLKKLITKYSNCIAYRTLKKKKKFTTLKSPHVNKKAKRCWVFYHYKTYLILDINNFSIFCLFLAQLKRFAFGLSLKVLCTNYKRHAKKSIIILNVIKTLEQQGACRFKVCLDSSVGRAKD